jgi:hypothetical protein
MSIIKKDKKNSPFSACGNCTFFCPFRDEKMIDLDEGFCIALIKILVETREKNSSSFLYGETREPPEVLRQRVPLTEENYVLIVAAKARDSRY